MQDERHRKAAYGRSKERLLATLMAAPTKGYTKAQLARLCDISMPYAKTLLNELKQEKLVCSYRVSGNEWKFQRVNL